MYQGDSFRSGAARVSSADNAAVTFNNPAALTELSRNSVLFEGTYYTPSVTYRDEGSTDAAGNPLNGNQQTHISKNEFTPGAYFAQRVNTHWAYGLALNTPFGLSVNWPDNWIGRYHVIESSIHTVNINPAVSYRVNNHVDLGFGLSAQYASAILSSAIDFGAVCYAAKGPITCNGLGLTPQSADGKMYVKGDDWGYGYTLGVFIHEHATNIGISYRSKIDYKLRGNADFTDPPQASAFAPAFTNTQVTVPLTLPEVFSAGLTQVLSPKWQASVAATWTRWSRVKSFNFHFSNAAQPPVTIVKNWHDTWRYALGVQYKQSSAWTFQGGIAYAESAIPDSTLDPSIPTANAWWFSAGVLYTISHSVRLGVGMNHIHFAERNINNTGIYGDTLRGRVSPKLNVYTARLEWFY